MANLTRRTALQMIGAAPMAAAIAWTPAEAQQAHHEAQRARTDASKRGAPFKPKFFTPHEYATVNVLVDLIIPRDERSGSATDAGVPEFMDFMMIDQPRRQVAMRGGLAFIDRLAEERFNKRFVGCSDVERRQIIDLIAFTNKVEPRLSAGVAFFSSFRDLTASGFWSSRMGVADLQYKGNVFIDEWNGCPDDALKKLGVKYG
jgi:gluconate 2-dehydrogenase gamma chain